MIFFDKSGECDFGTSMALDVRVSSDTPALAIISSLARALNGRVSVGEKAVALVKDRKR